jgi:hypothetical protein
MRPSTRSVVRFGAIGVVSALVLGTAPSAYAATTAPPTAQHVLFPGAALNTTKDLLADVVAGVAAAHAGDAAAQAEALHDAAQEARTLATYSPASISTMNGLARSIAGQASALAGKPQMTVADAQNLTRNALYYTSLSVSLATTLDCTLMPEPGAITSFAPPTPRSICENLQIALNRVETAEPGLVSNIAGPALCIVNLLNGGPGPCTVNTDAIVNGVQAITAALPANTLDFGCYMDDPTNPGGAYDESICEYAEPSGIVTDAQSSVATAEYLGAVSSSNDPNSGKCYGSVAKTWYQANNNSVFGTGQTVCDARWWQYNAHLSVQRKVCGWGGCHYEDRGVSKNWHDTTFKIEYHRDIAGATCKAGTHRWRTHLHMNRGGRGPTGDEYVEWNSSGIEYTCKETNIAPAIDMDGLVAGPASDIAV